MHAALRPPSQSTSKSASHQITLPVWQIGMFSVPPESLA